MPLHSERTSQTLTYSRFDPHLVSKVTRWLNGGAPGTGVPLVRHLALRGVPDAMTELSRLAVDRRSRAIALSADAMAHHVALKGYPPAAYNLAMQRFNAGDLQGYRRWLRQAAKASDGHAMRQLARFETRLPHGAARDLGRGRPYRWYD
jgi:hypothetical protein